MKEAVERHECAVEHMLFMEEKYEHEKRRMLANHGVSPNPGALGGMRRLVARARTEEMITRSRLVDAVELDSLPSIEPTDRGGDAEDFRRVQEAREVPGL